MTDFTLPNGTRVHLIGDPHLGKKFEVGVPVSRRGERERSQMILFRKELEADADVIIMVGDLFDHPYVGYSVVEEAAQAILSAAERNSGTTYVMIPGNHDLPRSVAAVGAFNDLEARIHDRLPNLLVVRKPAVVQGIALYPWEWDRSVAEQVDDLVSETPLAAVGHWDLQSYGGSDAHLAPVEVHADIPLYSGHFHIPGEYKLGGKTVICTGSMEPYSHGEDPEETRYVTLTRAEALSRTDLRHKCVRVILARGEDVPDIDALAITGIRQRDDITTEQQVLSLDEFDWDAILKTKLAPLHPNVKQFIEERLSRGSSEE